ncbi:hypothetical protein TNCV_1768141 [Trichonephila clavipes]|nr:hypothetical protein TNCV_1768141 [Trichonephila clavipes]
MVQTARVCICVLRTNRARETERVFCSLSMRRNEGHVLDPPMVFKKGFFSGDERRALDGENLRRALKKKRALDKKKGETMNAGGF